MADVFDRLNKIRTVDNPGKTPAKATERKTTKAAAGGNALERLDRVKTVDAMSRLDRIQTVDGKASAPKSSGKAEAREVPQPSGTSMGQGGFSVVSGARRGEETGPVKRPGLLSRVGRRVENTVKGAAKSYAASVSNALSNRYEGGQGGRDLQNQEYLQEYAHDLERAKIDLEAMRKANREAPGSWSEQDLQSQQRIVDEAQRKYDAMAKVIGEKVQQKATKESYQVSDDLQQSAAKDTEKAKAGLSDAGKVLVDAGGSLTQVGIDAAVSTLLGVPGTGAFALRAFGGAAQQARQENPDSTLRQQTLYGAASAAKEVFTEKMFNMALPFSKAYGGSGLDDAVERGIRKAVDRFAETDAGKRLLGGALTLGAGALGEGLEEFLGDWMEWQMPRIYGGNVASAEENLQNALYDFLVGSTSGLMGGVVTPSTYRYAPNGAPLLTDEQGRTYEERMAAEQKNAAPRTEAAEVSLDEARQIARNFGAELRVGTLEHGASGTYENGVITIDGNAKNPVRQVLVHELTHHMESSGLYGEFSDRVLSFVAEDMGVDAEAMARSITEEYRAAGVELSEDAARRELVAKFAEDKLFRDERSIQRLLRTDRNLFQKIYDWIRDTLVKVKGSSEEKFLADAQKLYEKALRNNQGGEALKTGQNLFAGERSKTADFAALREARERLAQGADAETVRRETGWFRGMDGKWRFEIDDSGMAYRRDGDAQLSKEPGYQRLQELERRWDSLTEQERAEYDSLANEYQGTVWEEKYLLRDFLRHDDLFRAYPYLNRVSLAFEDLDSGQSGYFDGSSNTIVLSNRLRNQPESTLTHEIQHVIQKVEGFSRGSSPEYWNRRMEEGYSRRRNDGRIEQAEKEYRRIFDDAPEEFKRKVREINRDRLRGDYEAAEAIVDELYAGEYADLWSQLDMADFERRSERGEEMLPSDLYRNTAGEIEARDAAARRSLTAEQRAEQAPDLGNENTVFAEGDGRTLYASMDIESEEQPHSRPYYAESAGDVMLRDADGKWVPREQFIQAEAERSVRELKGKSPFSEGFDRRILEDRTLLTATEMRKGDVGLALSNKRRNASATDAARRAVSGAGFETGDVRNDWTGLNITVGNNFYSETATNAASQRNESSVQALRAARELMKSAYLVGTAETQIDVKSSLKRKNNPHRLFQYIFAAPYSMDGPKIAVLRVDVMENQGDVLHRAYNLRSVEYKNAPLDWASEENLRAGFQDRATASGGYTISVADLVKNIKQDYVGNHVIFSAKEGTDITPRLTDEKGRTYEERQNSMGRSFTELVAEQRRAANGAPLLVDERGRTTEERRAAEPAEEPKVPDLAAESGRSAIPGDSGTDGYLDALAESGEPLRDPITPSDRIYEARLDQLQREEAPPERGGGTRIEKRDLDELAQLLQDTANPVTMAREARFEESAGLVSAETKAAKQTAREKAGEAKSYFLRKMVDAGDSVTRVAKATGDEYLYPFYNMARSSASAGINMIAGEQTDITGKRVGRSLNDIFQPIRAKGEDYYNQFQTYLFDLHNVDRMSLVAPDSTAKIEAEENLRRFMQENPDVAQMTEARLRKRAEDIDPDVAELARELLRLKREVDKADRLGNKPVFSFEFTAGRSRERAAQLLRENPEFAGYRQQVREYIHNLMQYRVDSGLMTQQDMDYLERYYPNYVPTFRWEEKQYRRFDPRNVRIGKTVGRAKGGNQKLVPLHEALGKMTMSVVREGSKNRFGERLLETWQNSGQNSRVREYLLDAEEYDASFDPDTFDGEDPTPRKENTFTVYKDGKQWEMQVDPTMFDAVKALSPDTKESNWFVNLVRSGNSLFKALVTGYNPTFVVRNTVRDLQTAGLYSRDGKAFLENYPLALREIRRDGAYWKQYKALGGSFSSVFDYQTGTVQEPSGKVAKLAARMEALNMAMEQAPRLAEFMSVVKAGDGSMENLMDAMHAAADVTVNFGRAGTLGKVLNANFVPFLNPGIQGFDKMIRRVTETKGAKQWSSLVVRAAALGIAPTLLNALLYSDDDDWEDLKDSDKDTNYLFKIKDGLWLKIPKGRELSILGMTADRMKDIVNGEDVDWRDFITTVGNQVAPANPLNQNILKAWFDADLSDPSSPGRTWYGGDIENQRLRNYAPGERYDSSTDIFSKWVGKQLGLSPKKINYLLDQYSGVVGDFLLPLLTPQAERDPFSKAFTVDSVNSNRLSGDFYDTAEQLTYAANGGDSTAKAASRFWNKQQKACSDLYAQIREIEESDLSDKEKKQKVKEVKAILNGIQKNALATLETYEGTVEKYLKGSGEEDVDLAYREANRECFGAEYALQVYNKDVYEKAKNAAAGGVSYEDYYTYYFETKPFQSSGGVSVATQKMRWLEASDFDDETKAEIYFADLASDSDLTKQAELENSSGLTAVEYWEYKMATNGIQADGTASGKVVTNSKKQKVLAAIDAMDITKEQKTALYYAAGYAESTLTEAPWMGLQVPRLDGGTSSGRKKSSGKSTGKSSSGSSQQKSGLSKYSLDKYRLG